MDGPIAYLSRQIVPAAEAVVPATDAGFLLGVTVAEQLRTFGGKLFRLDEHLQRLDRSLAIVGVDSGHSHRELCAAAEQVVSHNHALLANGDDLAVVLFVTPGTASSMLTERPQSGPIVCIHTRPLPFAGWADRYESGEALATTDVEQVSIRSWPAELKCRSRMHYYLADRQASARHPGARALMLDDDGMVTEATTANVLIYRKDDGMITPPHSRILPGISMSVLRELAQARGIRSSERNLRPHDVAAADEVLLCSTSPCVLPVTQFNGQAIGDGKPGPVVKQLLQDWSAMVGMEIVGQAERFAAR